MRRIILPAAGLFLSVITISSVSAAPSIQLRFTTFIQRGAAERDVFIEGEGLPSAQVDRVSPFEIKGGAILSKPLFTTTRGSRSGSAFTSMQGPFPKGPAVGFTLGQWLMAKGTGVIIVEGDTAQLKFSFRRIIPNGRYTMWCVVPGKPETPCGSADGSQNSFKADATGNATFDLKLSPMPAPMRTGPTIVALAYHSDGKNYGDVPGEFGVLVHVQLAVVAPPVAP